MEKWHLLLILLPKIVEVGIMSWCHRQIAPYHQDDTCVGDIGAFKGRHHRFKACIGAEVHNGFPDLALHPLNAMRLEYALH